MAANGLSEGELVLAAGYASEKGPRPENQDFGGIHLGTAESRARRGALAALADGVSSGKAGRAAAELAVSALIEGFEALPETLGPAQALHRPLEAYNRWLHAQGKGEAMAASATTLTAFAFVGRRAHLVHIGDTRAWRFARGHLAQLTTDHVRPERDMRHVLVRALGLEDALRLDHAAIELAERDRLLLTTDGVHGVLSERRIAEILGQPKSAEATADRLVEAALDAGGNDNATALVIDVVRLPAPDHAGILDALADLPLARPPKLGETIDGYKVERVIANGRQAVLLAAMDPEAGSAVALKFPQPQAAAERTVRLAFARELLIAQRVSSPFVLGAHPVRPDRASALYAVLPLLDGETMTARIERKLPGLTAGLTQAVRMTRAVAVLHRLGVIHRDIKPDNVMLTTDGGLKLIDLGVARLPGIEDLPGGNIPGTAGFMAPEQFEGNAGDTLTDQFALGVTLYRWFTGKAPYGEQEPFQKPRFAAPLPPSVHRSDIPAWLDHAILRACDRDRGRRYGDVVDLLRALEAGGPVAAPPRRALPLIERNPVRFWQGVSALLAAALAAVLLLHP